MKGFEVYLRRLGVREKELSYYVSWVKNYTQFCEDRSLDHWDKENISSYLKELSFRAHDWQVVQANDAVEKYMMWRRGEFEKKKEKLIAELKKVLVNEGRSHRTTQCYVSWIRRFFKHNQKDGSFIADDLRSFIIYLANEERVSRTSNNQSLAALRYFYTKVLSQEIDNVVRGLKVYRKRGLPKIFNCNELELIFASLEGQNRFLAKLMYGTGLRPGECYKLRVGDIGLLEKIIKVRGKEGETKREVFLPKTIEREMKLHLKVVRVLYEEDMQQGVCIDFRGERIEKKNENDIWERYWLFPSQNVTCVGGQIKRKARHACHLQKKFNECLKKMNMDSSISLDSFRHSFAVHLLDAGYNVRIVQEFMGYKDVKRMLMYERISHMNTNKVISPLDDIGL